jgi:hypothetical protein
MPTHAERYTDAIWRAKAPNLGVWPLGTDIQLGYVGVMRNRGFLHRTNLATLGISIQTAAEPARAQWVLAADGTFSIEGGGSGSAVVPAAGSGSVGGRLSFNRGGAVLVQAEEVTSARIDDIPELQREILTIDGRSGWDKDYRVVTFVAVAQRFRVLLAERKGAEVSFVASGSVLPTPAEVAEGRLQIGLELASVSGLEICEEFNGPAVVVFRAMRIKRGRMTEVGPGGGGLAPDATEQQLVHAGWDDVSDQ